MQQENLTTSTQSEEISECQKPTLQGPNYAKTIDIDGTCDTHESNYETKAKDIPDSENFYEEHNTTVLPTDFGVEEQDVGGSANINRGTRCGWLCHE